MNRCSTIDFVPSVLLVGLFLSSVIWAVSAQSSPAFDSSEFVGRERCATCHPNVANVQIKSDHALSVRKPEEVPEFVKALPLRFSDKDNAVEYSFEKPAGNTFRMVAAKGQGRDSIELLWAFGAGRKALTFVGRTQAGKYGQVRVSWYSAVNELDITPGSKAKVKDATDALADWFEMGKREECFSCHVSSEEEILPENISHSSVGVQCERCHGPGKKHVEAVTQGPATRDLAIRHPGRMSDREQYQFCGSCHRQPPADFDSEAISKIMNDKISIRYPARRLILSRCYVEGNGQLKCTACHNPHEQLAIAASDYDPKCISCHAQASPKQSACPVSRKDCVTCHMPRVSLAKHLDFADHWIRVVRESTLP